ncbi:hypothetical protein cypCar_00019943, partial [Cyprinus carpio]
LAVALDGLGGRHDTSSAADGRRRAPPVSGSRQESAVPCLLPIFGGCSRLRPLCDGRRLLRSLTDGQAAPPHHGAGSEFGPSRNSLQPPPRASTAARLYAGSRGHRGFTTAGQASSAARPPLPGFGTSIEILDKIPPSIINKEIPSTVENLLDGKQGIYITSKELKASDPDSPDYTLEFTITRPPHFGAYIKGRFTQKDLEQKAVHYGITADMEVTADSFEFQVTDPAGNTMLPEV